MESFFAPNKWRDFFRYCKYLRKKNPNKFRLNFNISHPHIQSDLCEGFTDLRIYETHLTFRPKLRAANKERIVINFEDIQYIDILFDCSSAHEMESVLVEANVSPRTSYFPLPLDWIIYKERFGGFTTGNIQRVGKPAFLFSRGQIVRKLVIVVTAHKTKHVSIHALFPEQFILTPLARRRKGLRFDKLTAGINVVLLRQLADQELSIFSTQLCELILIVFLFCFDYYFKADIVITMQTITEIKNKIEPILENNDVAFAGIFGSYARGEARSDSDVDVLVKFKTPKGLFDIVGLEQELSEAVHTKVDLVTLKAICPYIADRVYKDFKLIYGER